MCRIAWLFGLSISATAGDHLTLIVPADPRPIQQALAMLTTAAPPAAMIAEMWAIPAAGDPALIRRWTYAFAHGAQDDGRQATLDAEFQRAVARIAEPRELGALAFDFIPAPNATRMLDRLAAEAFDHGDFHACLALSPGLADDRRRTVAFALCGGAAEVDPSLTLTDPGMPHVTSPTELADETQGMTVTWRILPDRLVALDPWQRPRWERRFSGQAEIHTGPGGALVSDATGVHLVREDGALVPADLPSPGDQNLWFSGSTAWFVHGATARGFSVTTGIEQVIRLSEPPVAPPLVRGAQSLWLTAHEMVLCRNGTVNGRIRHGLHPTSAWRLGAQQAQIFIRAPEATFAVPALADQLASASPAHGLSLLVNASRYREAIALARQHPSAADEAGGRKALLVAYLADGIAEDHIADLLRLAATPLEEAQALEVMVWERREQGLIPGRIEAQFTELLRRHSDLRLPRSHHDIGTDPDFWSHTVSAAAWLGIPTAGARYTLGEGAESTDITCTDEPGGVFRWRHRWPTPPVASGAPQRSLAQRGEFLVIGEGTSRLVVLEPMHGDLVGIIDLAQIDAEPTQVTVLGLGSDRVLRLAILHPIAVDDHLTICGSDGSTITTHLPTVARTVRRISPSQAQVDLTDGRTLIIGDAHAR